MKSPGPDHPITITPATARWRAKFAGHVIADTADAVVLKESTYPQVVYFPRADVSMDYMRRTDRSTHCPYKGDASYFTVLMDGQFAENAVWSYEQPFPAMAEIEDRLAFYTDKIEVYRLNADGVNPEPMAANDDHTISIGEVVQHTDSGSGASQKEHWPTNVSTPETSD